MNTSSLLPIRTWFMLVSRSVLFLAFQTLFALVFWLAGKGGWSESARWWVFVAALANLVSITLLVMSFRAEGQCYLDLLHFSRKSVKTDLLWFFGACLIGLPLASLPMSTLAVLLFGDSMAPVKMLFQPLPTWALALGLFFPLTIAFAELPTYFGYVMPRLEAQLKNGWAAWVLSALFLGIQHCFLPLIFDGRFILWRAGMYLPFALFVGLILKLRPSLFPYLVILHALMDLSALSVYFLR